MDAIGRLRAAVKTDLHALDPGPGALVLVACSGGADSLALAAAVALEAREVARTTRRRGYRIQAAAVVVDHGLQPNSAEVAQTAATACTQVGLQPVSVVRVQVGTGPGSGGPEAAAREARYRTLGRAASQLEAAAVYLGHTQDDQAESVLLGLARGSGARSLSGMAAVHGRFRRPFLGLRRADTEAACALWGMTAWRDPWNEPAAPALRSRVRHEVLPALETVIPGAVGALARTADLLRADADVLDALAAALLDRACVSTGEHRVELAVGALAAAPAAIRTRALRRAAQNLNCTTTQSQVQAIDDLVLRWHGQAGVSLPFGVTAHRACDRLILESPKQASEKRGRQLRQ